MAAAVFAPMFWRAVYRARSHHNRLPPFLSCTRGFSSDPNGFQHQPSLSMESCWNSHFHNSLLRGLAKHSVGFPINGRNVEVLVSPAHFYQTLKDSIRCSKERVVMSSLYIGTGALEQDLMNVVSENLSSNPHLQVLFLFDALRSTRRVRPEAGQFTRCFESSTDMLTNMLLAKSAKWRQSRDVLQQEEQVRIALYRTPNLTKGLEKILPPRLNEVVGVSHMKIYVFDNNILMSGANLSSSYFTNRQDRYILLQNCSNLADYFVELVETVASFSYMLDKEGQLQRNAVNIDPRTKPVYFRREMFRAMERMLESHTNISSLIKSSSEYVGQQGRLWLDGQSADTWVFPTVQMGSLGIRQDETCFLWLLENLPADSSVQFASAYFNLTKDFQAAILRASSDKIFKILTAAPQANGFYGSRGVSSLIPKAYSMLEKDFFERTCKQVSEPNLPFAFSCDDLGTARNQRCEIQLYEYKRPEWTFHAKGLWCCVQNDTLPSMTLIGSSNFGYRSRQRDLEAQLFLTTLEPTLRRKLQEEARLLFLHGQRVLQNHFLDPERSGGRMSLLAAQLVRSWL